MLFLLVTIYHYEYVLRENICRCRCHSDFDSHNLVWFDFKFFGLNADSRLATDFFTQRNEPSDSTFVLEFEELGLLLAHWDELEVDNWLKLDIRRRHQSMQIQTIRLCVALCQDFDEVMEVTWLGRLELHAHFDGKASRHAADILILAVEARVLRLSEHDTTHILGNVPDRHSHFIVLIWFDI